MDEQEFLIQQYEMIKEVSESSKNKIGELNWVGTKEEDNKVFFYTDFSQKMFKNS